MSPKADQAGRPITRMSRPAHHIAPIFAALGDPTRLHIIQRLSTGHAYSITELTHGTPVTRQAITKHLRVLADSGLIRDKKIGRERRWQADPKTLHQARQTLDEIASQWDHALAKLKTHVEK